MKRGTVCGIAVISALLMVLAGCEGPAGSNVGGDDGGSGHYYVDRVPASGIPIVDDLNNGDQAKTDYALAEAFNKYDALYFVGGNSGGVTVAVPPGKTLYVAPGSTVAGFSVAAELSRGDAARDLGLDAGAGPGALVVLDGATMSLSGVNSLGGLLQVNVGGIINGSGVIAGSGRVVVGGKLIASSITVAGEVYVARGDGSRHGIVQADIDTTYLAPAALVPDGDGKIGSERSDDDFYAFENAGPETARNVTIDGVALGNITSGGNVYVGENDGVTGLNKFYGYVAGNSGEAAIIAYGNVEALGNVEGRIIANGAVTVGSKLDPPRRAQVRSAIYSRAGNVTIGKNAVSGDITAYQGNVFIEAGGGATGIDTYYNNNPNSIVNRGEVMVRGRIASSLGGSAGSGNIISGGSVVVARYASGSGGFGYDGYVSGSVASGRSATIDGVVGGSLDTSLDSHDRTGAGDVIVNGYVGGRVIAGGALAVADHHDAPENSNPGKYLGSIYANGYVGGGAEVHGAGQSAIRGLVEGGSLYVGSLAELVIAATGRVNAFDSQGVSVEGKLIIEASGELDVDGIGEISGHSGSFNDLHIFAHAESLANEGRLGPPGSGVTLARGARLYTRTPVTVPALANLDFDRGIQTGSVVAPDVLDARFRALAGSAVLHATIAAPANLGASAPLAFTVGAHNVVALTQNTVLAGNVDLQGSLRLNGHELALAGAITVASDNSPVSHYSDGADYANGSIYFEAAGSEHSALHFAGAAAALNGLGLSAEKAGGADGSGNPFNAAPVVTEVESSSGSTVAVFRSPFPPTAPGGPGGNFAPGSGALLAGSAYGGLAWINKDSRFVWRFTARVP